MLSACSLIFFFTFTIGEQAAVHDNRLFASNRVIAVAGQVATMSMPAAEQVCATVEPYEQCGGINNCPLCPLRSGAGSNYVCRFPLLPRFQACSTPVFF